MIDQEHAELLRRADPVAYDYRSPGYDRCFRLEESAREAAGMIGAATGRPGLVALRPASDVGEWCAPWRVTAQGSHDEDRTDQEGRPML